MALNGADLPSNPHVIMWCVPRSGSTVVAKCMSFVPDIEVWLEPYVLSTSMSDIFFAVHPDDEDFPFELEGNEALYRETVEKIGLGGNVDEYNLQNLSPVFLKSSFDSEESKKKPLFVKDMAVGMPPSRYQYLPDKSSGFKHMFLVRSPLKAYMSYRKGMLEHTKDMPDEAFEEMGLQRPTEETLHIIDSLPELKEGSKYFFEAIHNLWNYIKKNVDEDAVVLDIDDLLNDPSSMLPRLFEVLGIPYSERLLTWDQSSDVVLKWKSCCPNVRDSPRYARWFTRAFESSCFEKPTSDYEPSLKDATEDVREVVEREMPFYREMYDARLTL